MFINATMIVLGKQSPIRRLEKYGGNNMKYTNRLMASLVAAVFILSLFSGFAGAQTTEELNIKTRDYLIRAIDQTVSHLEILKYRVELRENKGIIPFDASGNIEAHVTQLEAIRVKVQQAETAKDFIAIHSELKDLWVKIRLKTRYYVGIVLNYRIDGFLSKADNVSIKMDEAITNLDDKGIDTTKLKAEAAKFDSIVDDAKQNQQKTDDLFAVHNGFASDSTVSDVDGAREFLRQADGMQRDTVKKLKDAARQLKDFVKDFRKLARGMVTIEGSSTETLSGN
ncbi:hypothetical protein ig2599ANME_0757 [groundwater metagenome]